MQIQIVKAMLNGTNILDVLPNATIKDYYFYIKAFKLTAPDKFFAYCAVHKDLDNLDSRGSYTPFHQMLIDILMQNYPPLTYNHTEQEGYEGLSTYVAAFKQELQHV